MNNNNNGLVTICTNCIFYTKRCYRHTCTAQVKPAIDFVTGKKYLIGYKTCKQANPRGKCFDYRRI